MNSCSSSGSSSSDESDFTTPLRLTEDPVAQYKRAAAAAKKERIAVSFLKHSVLSVDAKSTVPFTAMSDGGKYVSPFQFKSRDGNNGRGLQFPTTQTLSRPEKSTAVKKNEENSVLRATKGIAEARLRMAKKEVEKGGDDSSSEGEDDEEEVPVPVDNNQTSDAHTTKVNSTGNEEAGEKHKEPQQQRPLMPRTPEFRQFCTTFDFASTSSPSCYSAFKATETEQSTPKEVPTKMLQRWVDKKKPNRLERLRRRRLSRTTRHSVKTKVSPVIKKKTSPVDYTPTKLTSHVVVPPSDSSTPSQKQEAKDRSLSRERGRTSPQIARKTSSPKLVIDTATISNDAKVPPKTDKVVPPALAQMNAIAKTLNKLNLPIPKLEEEEIFIDQLTLMSVETDLAIFVSNFEKHIVSGIAAHSPCWQKSPSTEKNNHDIIIQGDNTTANMPSLLNFASSDSSCDDTFDVAVARNDQEGKNEPEAALDNNVLDTALQSGNLSNDSLTANQLHQEKDKVKMEMGDLDIVSEKEEPALIESDSQSDCQEGKVTISTKHDEGPVSAKQGDVILQETHHTVLNTEDPVTSEGNKVEQHSTLSDLLMSDSMLASPQKPFPADSEHQKEHKLVVIQQDSLTIISESIEVPQEKLVSKPSLQDPIFSDHHTDGIDTTEKVEKLVNLEGKDENSDLPSERTTLGVQLGMSPTDSNTISECIRNQAAKTTAAAVPENQESSPSDCETSRQQNSENASENDTSLGTQSDSFLSDCSNSIVESASSCDHGVRYPVPQKSSISDYYRSESPNKQQEDESIVEILSIQSSQDSDMLCANLCTAGSDLFSGNEECLATSRSMDDQSEQANE